MTKTQETQSQPKQGVCKEKVGNCHPPKHSQWKPGQSGNPKGSQKHKPLTDEFNKRLNDAADGDALAAEMIDIALKAARKHDFRFWQELMNRSDGKVTDKIEHSGNVDSLVTQEKFEDMDNERKKRLLRTAGITDVLAPGDGADPGPVDTGGG